MLHCHAEPKPIWSIDLSSIPCVQRKGKRWQSRATLKQRLDAAELQQLASDAENVSLHRALEQAHAFVLRLRANLEGAYRARDDAKFCLRESSQRTLELQARCERLELKTQPKVCMLVEL